MMKSKEPCEVCGKEPALSCSWFRDYDASFLEPNGQWKLVGWCTKDTESYWITFDMLRDQSVEFWRSHLSHKPWFDAAEFDAVVSRLEAHDEKGHAHAQKRGNRVFVLGR